MCTRIYNMYVHRRRFMVCMYTYMYIFILKGKIEGVKKKSLMQRY